ncbi:MAG: class I SAM-dependent methyltransferase [Spirochaetota bacterium]
MADWISGCMACASADLRQWMRVPAQMHPTAEQFDFQECGNCGLIQLNPRVSPENLGTYYSGYYLPFRGPAAWGKYAPLVQMNLRKTDRKRAALARKAAADSGGGRLGPQSRVLDVGCGKPTFLERLHSQTGSYSKGIDFSDEGWRQEPGRFAGLDLEVAEFQQFQSTAQFDVITMWHYLEHDYHPRETRQRMLGLAHRHTRLIIEVPDFGSWTRAVQGRYWEGFHTPRHTAVYSPETLRVLLERSGWKLVRMRRFGTLDAYPLFWMGQQERRGIDWSGSMEGKFAGFMAGMLATAPLFLLKRWLPAGVMTAVARPE